MHAPLTSQNAPIIPEVLPAKRPRGRPKGTKNPDRSPEVKLRIKAQKAMRMRLYRMTDKLLNAQNIVAVGTHKMITISKDDLGIDHVKTIRDQKHMQKLLDEGRYGVDYFIVVNTLPDWKAADALLNRAHGKAKESVAFDVNHTFSLRDLATKRLDALNDEAGAALLDEEEKKLLDMPDSADSDTPISS